MVNATNSYTIKSFFKAAGINKAIKSLKNVQKVASKAAIQMNRVLGGKTAQRNSKAFGQNLSAISNRLGFMAFQWKFMAGAARQAMDTVIGGLKRIIIEGAKTGDAVVRALAFAAPISELSRMTDSAARDIAGLDAAIRKLGSGKTIFGLDSIAGQALELQKAFDDLDATKTVLPFVAMLKTIDPTISDEKLGTGLVSLFAALDINTRDINQVAAAMDFLSNVSDKSTANFQSSIASISLAAQQAKSVGFVVTDLGSIIQTVSDDLAKNKGGGRASGSAGRFANAFLADLQAISDPLTKQGAFARQKGLDIFTKDLKTGAVNFKEFIPLIDVFRKKIGALKGTANKSAFLSQLGFGVISQQTLNVLMAKTTKELIKQNEELLERGTLAGRANLIQASGQSQILRMQAAISSAKVSLVRGFRPALAEIANLLQGIAESREFVDFLNTIGKILAGDLIPIVRKVTKIFKVWFAFLRKNPKLLKTLVGAVVLLTGALAGLFVITTIGFFALVAAASFTAMGGQAFLAAGGLKVLAASTLTLIRSWIPFILLGVGAAIVLAALTGIFDDSLTPAVIALGVAISALGVAFLFPMKSISLFKGALMTIPKLLGSIALLAGTGSLAGFKNLGRDLGASFSGAFSKNTKAPITANTKGLLKSLGGLKGVGIIAAIAIGAAFAVWLNKAVLQSPVFQGGLTTKWEEAGIQLKAAVTKTVRAILGIFREMWLAGSQMIADLGATAGKVLNLLVIALGDLRNPAKWEAFTKAVNEAFNPRTLKSFFAELLDPDLEALTNLKETFAKFREQIDSGKVSESLLSKEAIRKIIDSRLKLFSDATLTPQEIINAVNEGFGSTLLGGIMEDVKPPEFSFDDILPTMGAVDFEVLEIGLLAEAMAAANIQITDVAQQYASVEELLLAQAQAMADAEIVQGKNIKILEKENKLIEDTIKIVTEGNKQLGIKTDSTTDNNVAINENTGAESDNTVRVDENTGNVLSSTKTIIENIDFLKKEIVAIAKNTNVFTSMSEMILNVNVMWAKLIAQGNRAAGKLSSLRVDDSGRFTIQDPGISSSDSANISKQKSILSAFISGKDIINIEGLTEELSKIATTLAEGTTVIGGGRDLTERLDDIDKTLTRAEIVLNKNLQSGITEFQLGGVGGRSARVLTDLSSGTSLIDINIDGTFDINVQQGGLTEQQILELQTQVGESITDAIIAKLGVQI